MNKPYVFAMRIYLSDGYRLMADLAILKDGECIAVDTINYDQIEKRDAYYFNAYTLIWDERVIKDMDSTFSEYVNRYTQNQNISRFSIDIRAISVG